MSRLDIDKMTSNEWLEHRRQKVDEFYARGGELKPEPNCRMCDVENDYVCLDHEIQQTGE